MRHKYLKSAPINFCCAPVAAQGPCAAIVRNLGAHAPASSMAPVLEPKIARLARQLQSLGLFLNKHKYSTFKHKTTHERVCYLFVPRTQKRNYAGIWPPNYETSSELKKITVSCQPTSCKTVKYQRVSVTEKENRTLPKVTLQIHNSQPFSFCYVEISFEAGISQFWSAFSLCRASVFCTYDSQP